PLRRSTIGTTDCSNRADNWGGRRDGPPSIKCTTLLRPAFIATLFSALAMAGLSAAKERKENWEPSGSSRYRLPPSAAAISARRTLHYGGKSYNFTIGGLRAGGIGSVQDHSSPSSPVSVMFASVKSRLAGHVAGTPSGGRNAEEGGNGGLSPQKRRPKRFSLSRIAS